MNKFIFLSFILVFCLKTAYNQDNFNTYFASKTMRVDYYHAGTHDSEHIYPAQILSEPFWGGMHKNLIDTFFYGDYFIHVYDSISSKLIYSRGYSSLFREWQDTEEAKQIESIFYESVIFPYPKNPIRIEILSRDRKNNYHAIYIQHVNPNDYMIKQEDPPKYDTKKVFDAGATEKCLDIAILAEGYTKKEMKKFRKDAKGMIDYFFSVPPFDEYKSNTNIWLIESFSEESGTDNPGKNEWKQTILNTSFYTFHMERYLTTLDYKSVRDIASAVPYDQIYILSNTEKYGGGGIYNFYNLCTSDNELSLKVFVHEFGHGFASLADEYDYPGGPPEERYDLTVEPNSPNITTLVNLSSKWKHLVPDSVEIPTPVESSDENTIGAFEGAGYVEEKLYRPMLDCRMRSNNTDKFCPVCQEAIRRMYKFYVEY